MKSKVDLIKEWLKKAENDLKAIKLILNGDNPPTDIICFHVQQAIEKYLKGLLIFFEIDFPKIHDLEELIELLKGKIDFRNLKEKAAEISSFAVEIRYPDTSIMPSLKEAQEAYKTALIFKDKILKKLKDKL